MCPSSMKISINIMNPFTLIIVAIRRMNIVARAPRILDASIKNSALEWSLTFRVCCCLWSGKFFSDCFDKNDHSHPLNHARDSSRFREAKFIGNDDTIYLSHHPRLWRGSIVLFTIPRQCDTSRDYSKLHQQLHLTNCTVIRNVTRRRDDSRSFAHTYCETCLFVNSLQQCEFATLHHVFLPPTCVKIGEMQSALK